MMEKNLYPEIPKEKFAFFTRMNASMTKSCRPSPSAIWAMRGCASARTSPPCGVLLDCVPAAVCHHHAVCLAVHGAVPRRLLQVGAAKNTLFENAGFWDGARKEKVSEIGYHYYNAIGQETGVPVVKKEYDHYTDSNGVTYYNLRVDSYARSASRMST